VSVIPDQDEGVGARELLDLDVAPRQLGTADKDTFITLVSLNVAPNETPPGCCGVVIDFDEVRLVALDVTADLIAVREQAGVWQCF
jgi:hypothetical protein